MINVNIIRNDPYLEILEFISKYLFDLILSDFSLNKLDSFMINSSNKITPSYVIIKKNSIISLIKKIILAKSEYTNRTSKNILNFNTNPVHIHTRTLSSWSVCLPSVCTKDTVYI